jgi:predicted nucleotidyltransferase
MTIAGLVFTVTQSGSTPFTDIGAALPRVTTGSTEWGDYDNDGDLDLLLIGYTGSGSLAGIYRNDGGTFVDIGANLSPEQYTSAAWGDYDGDGDLDLAITGRSGSGGNLAKIFRNDSGTFVDIGALLVGLDSGSVAWGDYDGDGDLDLLQTGCTYFGNPAQVTALYRNDGNGVFTAVNSGLPAVCLGSAVWGDYDGDGDLDVALVSSSLPLRIYRTDSGIFTLAHTLTVTSDGRKALAWADYDNDGRLDLAVASVPPMIFRNTGSGFVTAGAVLEGGSHGSIAWGDYDNDGDPDLLIVSDGKTKLYRNDAGSFVDASAAFPVAQWMSVAWGDYDGDSDLDVILTGDPNEYPFLTKVFRNDLASPNQPPSAPTDLQSTVGAGTVSLRWNPASDSETPTLGLSYSLRMGTGPGRADIVPSSALASGRRTVVERGIIDPGTMPVLRLPPGTYYWSVQTVDSAFAGSAFATETAFTYCGYSLDRTSQSVPGTGPTYTVNVTAATGCVWTAASNDNFITVTSGSSGSGNGTATFTVAPINTAGTLTIAGVTFTVNQTADTDGDGIPDTIESAEGTNPTVKDNDIFSATPIGARRFVMQQYRDFLGREGDPGGITFWTNQINSGAVTRAQVINSFFNSAEFQNTTAPVTRLYFAYFLRIPDYGGLLFWVNAYKSGMTLQSISDVFASSAEFNARYGSLNNTDFVTLVYNNVLGRPPDAGGLAFWVGQLTSGAMTRGQVMLNFSESNEYKSKSFNKVFVTQIYVGMLRRAPDQGGFNFWVGQLDGGASGLNLIQGFLVSAEYHNRFLPPASSPELRLDSADP